MNLEYKSFFMVPQSKLVQIDQELDCKQEDFETIHEICWFWHQLFEYIVIYEKNFILVKKEENKKNRIN